jgi:ribonuclease P protein component
MAAEKDEARADARFFAPKFLNHWSSSARAPSPQGTRPTLGLRMNATRRVSSADFRGFRPSRRIQGDFFSLSLAPHQKGPKWACVVSKKVSAKAVARNRIKRRCRSVLHSLLKGVDTPIILVLQAKRSVAGASFAEVERDVSHLLQRAGVVQLS